MIMFSQNNAVELSVTVFVHPNICFWKKLIIYFVSGEGGLEEEGMAFRDELWTLRDEAGVFRGIVQKSVLSICKVTA